MSDRSNDYVRGQRLSLIGLFTNAGLAVVKLIAGVLGNSYALIADAVESMADIFGSAIVWAGLCVADRPADSNHPYGHGKAEALAGFLVALMLIGAGLGIGIEAVREILVPHHCPAPFTLWVLIGVIVVKEILFRVVHRAAKSIDSRAVLIDAWHHRGDAITSLAAAIGITIAIVGGPGYESADDYAALLASGVIIVNAVRLIRGPLHELMDAEPSGVGDEVRRVASQVAGVAAIEKLLTRKSGLRYWVDMHLEVDPSMTVHAAHAVSHQVKDAVRAALPAVEDVLIHIEPHKP